MSKRNQSIKVLNYILFLGIIYFSIYLYYFNDTESLKIIFLITNFIFLTSFFLLNFLYNREFNRKTNLMEDLFDDKISITDLSVKNEFSNNIRFLETAQMYSFLKKIYIKKKLREKDYSDLEATFLKFVPKSFLDEIGIYGNERITLGISSKKKLNIMFLDIIGFTAISEKLTPERTLLLLNIYFDGIVEIIKDNGGYVDKFLGDGMMVIFDQENSDNTIKAAIEIQNFIKKFNFSYISRQIKIGIGINSGEIIMGTIGSKSRMEITVIGDVVNIASRLEKLSRFYNRTIIISEDTFNDIKNKNDFKIDYLGKKEVKGKEAYIKLYGI